MRKKSKEDEQNLAELNWAHRRSQAKSQLVQTSYIKGIKLFLFLPYNKHLINRAKSICTHDLGQDSPIQTSCSVNKMFNLLYGENKNN